MKCCFKPQPEIPVSTVAARHEADPCRLAAMLGRRTCEVFLRFTSGIAAEISLRPLSGLNLRGARTRVFACYRPKRGVLEA
uniref:Uncharacterized protein n=1 Tax=Thermofilum pendens TaxID=2269 RepID=A0A7C4FEC3_THEPE